MPSTILVTPRSITRHGHPALDRLRAAGWTLVFCRPGELPTEEELRALLPGCAGYLAGVEPITARTLESADTLRVISRNGTGIDAIDSHAAALRGIVIRRAEGANARGVAELVMAHLLALARQLVTADASLKSGAWARPHIGTELEGKTLGLIGCGRVGQIVARLALAFGMSVRAFDPAPCHFSPGSGFAFASLPDVLATADFLSLHCPPPAHGRPILDASSLAQLKPGAFLVNTARHDLLSPDAALVALDSGHLAGLALDVFDAEPPADHRLSTHPKVVATPHLGGFTRESIERAVNLAVTHLLEELGHAPASAPRHSPPPC